MKKRIEEAAMRNATCRFYDDDDEILDISVKSFEDGALWRINSVWHDVSEEPKEHKLVLIEDDFCGEPDYGVWQAPFPNWEDSIVHFSSKRWAYLEDLLPERKEENQ